MVQQRADLCGGGVQELATGVAAHRIALRRAGSTGGAERKEIAALFIDREDIVPEEVRQAFSLAMAG
jgi:hypothetical protein